jgi:hypothetical protein
MKRIILLSITILIGITVFAQNDLSVNISTKRLKYDVYFLASDSLGGRKFPLKGADLAANYIASQFEAINLKPISDGPNGYFQIMPVTKLDKGETRIYKDKLPPIAGFYYSFASNKPINDSLTKPIKYWGKQMPTHRNLNDTIVHIYGKKIEDAMASLEKIAAETNATNFALTLSERRNKRFIWKEMSASGYKYPNSMIRSGSPDWLYNKLPQTDDTLRVFMFNVKTLHDHYGKSIKELNRQSKSAYRNKQLNSLPTAEITYKSNFHIKTDTLFDRNVIGYIEGTDLKDEVVIICGHFDHVGRGPNGMNLGADDNASGTAGVMELARMCAQAKSNGFEFRRSVMFIAFGAEESGLNGSMFYVNNPIFPLEKTVMVINMDMIGRSDNKPENPGRLYTWPIGRHAIKRPTKKLLRSVDKQFKHTHFYFKQKFPENIMWFMGSDHFPFYRKGVPALVVTTGTHDDYHKPADTADKINYDNMANAVKALFVLTTDVASYPEKYPLKKE